MKDRRKFLGNLALMGAAGAAAGARSLAAAVKGTDGEYHLPEYACAQDYRSLKQSSYDRTGGNSDNWPMTPGATQEVFNSEGPGVITHIWFTIAADSRFHLKEIVLRMFWDGESKPSVEVPVGDFFGLNLGEYNLYQSAFLNCSSVEALNCYFAMPFSKSARITVTNEGTQKVGSNIDYQLVPSLPERSLYFHSQYRQATLNTAVKYPGGRRSLIRTAPRIMHHLWMGEGEEMIFIDDKDPSIVGTGSEDYFCGAWDFGGRGNAIPFANLYNGARMIAAAELAGGRHCLYRRHADNPVTFRKSLKYTMEHGHANDRSDCFYSVAYWHQTEPFTDFPQLPAVAERNPALKL